MTEPTLPPDAIITDAIADAVGETGSIEEAIWSLTNEVEGTPHRVMGYARAQVRRLLAEVERLQREVRHLQRTRQATAMHGVLQDLAASDPWRLHMATKGVEFYVCGHGCGASGEWPYLTKPNEARRGSELHEPHCRWLRAGQIVNP